MRLHWKKGPMMHKDGHHQMKRKHFKKMMLRSMFDEGDMSCKKRHFSRMMKHRSIMGPGHHGKGGHFRGHSSSDSDDSGCGKRNHFKRMMRHCSPAIFSRMHHGKFKHSRGKPRHSSSSDSDDDDQHHHGRRKHFMGMRRRCHSMSPFGDRHGQNSKNLTHPRDVRKESMPPTETNQRPEDTQGQSMSHSGVVQQDKEAGCMTSNERGHCSKDNQGQSMEKGSAGKGHHSKGRPESCTDDDGFERHCMSDHGRKHHKKMGRRGGCMTDLEEGHHGRGRHFRGLRAGHMFGDRSKGHKHDGMMHHFKRKHWMRGHDKSGFFGDDSALVPICAIDVENPPETVQIESNGNQSNDATETGIEDTAITKEQGTQTTAIMEIVIEDQEAQNAAISIVNKFL